jgi:hypothetical protein
MMAEALRRLDKTCAGIEGYWPGPHGIAVAPLSATGHIWPAGGDGSAILGIARSQAFALNTHENPVVQPGLGQHGEAQSRSALALCSG